MIYQFKYRDISKALYNSLNHEPFYKELERCISSKTDECKEAMLKYFDYSMIEAQRYGELFIPENKIFGASIWCKPLDGNLSKSVSSEKKEFLRKQLGECCLKKYSEIVEFMSDKAKDIIPANTWYLSIVGVDPQLQGQGFGVTLVQPILDKADKVGVPSYLETFDSRNKNFYKKLGYTDVASFLEPVTGSEYWVMFREPRDKEIINN